MGDGKKLQAILKDRGMAISQFSKETGISPNTLYAIIKRDSALNAEAMGKTAKSLFISVDELSRLLHESNNETAKTFQDPYLLDSEIDNSISELKETVEKLNYLTSAYEVQLSKMIEMRERLQGLAPAQIITCTLAI